jgi:hypothetical protein
MKLRCYPQALRALAEMAQSEDGFKSINREMLVQQLGAVLIDLEIMAEDLDMEREMTRDMAHDIAVRTIPKALR